MIFDIDLLSSFLGRSSAFKIPKWEDLVLLEVAAKTGLWCWLIQLLYNPKANVVPIHKKGEKDLMKNYHPVSLLSIFENFFERLIFNFLFKYIDGNELLNPNQSGFCSFHSCVAKPTSIYKPWNFFKFWLWPTKEYMCSFLRYI